MELRRQQAHRHCIAIAHDSHRSQGAWEEGTGPGEYMIADHRQQEAGRATGERRRAKGGGLSVVRLRVRAGNKTTTERLGFGEASHVERRRGLQE